MELANYIESLGSPGDAIFAVAGLLCTAYLLGRLLLFRMTLAGADQFFLAIVFGLDCLILIATPCQWFGFLPDVVLKYTFGGCLIIAVYLLLRRAWAHMQKRSPIPWHLTPFLAIAVLLWRNALSYPYSFDDLTYQIAVPMRWMKANSLEVFGDNPFSAFPGVNLIANLVLLKTGGLLAPLLFTYALGLILTLAIHFLLRRRLPPWPATILTLSMVLSLSFLMVTTSAYAEPMILLQFVAILFVLERASAWDWLLIGVFSGFAASVKLTGGIIAAAMALYFLAAVWRNPSFAGPQKRLLALLSFVGPMTLVTLLFYARPWLATGDPCYPYFADWFTDRPSTLAMSEYHHDAGRIQFGQKLDGPWQTIRWYFATPILLTAGQVMESTYDGFFGWQCLIYAILIGSRIRKNAGKRPHSQESGYEPMLWCHLGFALLFYTFWFFTAQQSRFLLPALLCVVLAGADARPLLTGRIGAVILSALLILTIASLPVRILEQVVVGWKDLIIGRHRAIDYLNAAIQDKYLTACARIRDLTPVDAKVMLLYEQRGLYVPRAYVIGTPYFQERFFTPPSDVASDEQVMETLHRAKITHVLVAFNPKDPDRMEKYMGLGRPFQKRIERLAVAGRLRTLWPDVTRVDVVDYALYKVEP